ncbi:hypothetical protein ACFYYS_38630 [Streptomyces sp. NPDC002120]|uniref:hypothetical protein n=1 Tax=Streptomyces sp. NPDC002120 TaxID=3364631 RepID=UPI00369A9C67
MARTKPSAAHLALVRAIREHGRKATTTQVERWQQQGWLPKASAWFEPGSPTIRPLIMHRALWLASNARAGRSIGWWGWVFWAVDDTPASAQRLRAALVAALKRPLARAGIEKIPAGNSNRAFQARQDAAAKMLTNRRAPRRDLGATMRAHAAEAGLELPRALGAALPNIFHRALMDPGARLLLGGSADIGMEELLHAMAQAMPDHPETIQQLREAHRQAELEGTDLLAQSPFAQGISGMVRTVETTDDRDLCHAVRTCTRATVVLEALMRRAPDEPAILALLTRDVMWEQWARVGGITPEGTPGLAAVAINTFQYLAMPDWAADLDRYLSFMDNLLVACHEPPGSSGNETET